MSDAPSPSHTPRGRLAAWFERTSHPGLFLVAVIILLYWPSLTLPYLVDDYRNMRILRDSARTSSPHAGLYEFVFEPNVARADRAAGWLPWWIHDDLRFRFFRPVANAAIALDFRLFGERPWASRLVSMAWYAVGVGLALQFFRVLGDEVRARWAALIFALAGSHTIPVIFPAARCDLMALVFALAATLLVARFVRCGGAWALLAGAIGYGLAIASKEASLPLAAAPVVLWLLHRQDRTAARRGLIASALFVVIAVGFFKFYSSSGYGSNSSMMLDPIRDPADFLVRGAGRTVLMLASWWLPANPFPTYFRETFHPARYALGAVGVVVLALVLRMMWQRHRDDRRVWVMGLWSLAFMPVLACTPADDRVMLLPSVGLAYLAGAWISRASPPSGRLPFIIFLAACPAVAGGTIGVVRTLERQAIAPLADGLEAARKVGERPTIFLLNTPMAMVSLWPQDRLRSLPDSADGRVAVLTDVAAPRVEAIGPNTLRFTATDETFLSSFLGRMGRVRGRPPQRGERVELDEFSMTLTKVEAGRVLEMQAEFRRPVSWEGYCFYEINVASPPTRRQFEFAAPDAATSTHPTTR